MKRLVIYSLIVSLLASTILTGCSTEETTSITNDNVEAPVETEIVTDASQEPNINNMTLKTDSGEAFTFNVPKDMYLLSNNYLDLVQEAYNVDDKIDSSLIVIGNETDITTSTVSINATTYSDVFNLYSQIYVDFVPDEHGDDILSIPYLYHRDGKLPDNANDTYQINVLNTYDIEGHTFTVYSVAYDTDVDNTTVHNKYIAAYSDTEDVIEIMIFADHSKGMFDEYIPVLKEFLGVVE